MRYVLKRIEDGKYVAKRGSEHSYTRRLEDAATFRDRSHAQAEACGNEFPVALDDLLAGNYR